MAAFEGFDTLGISRTENLENILSKNEMLLEDYEEKSIWTRHCSENLCTIEPKEGLIGGKVPDWLSGTLYRVGPGVLCFGEECYEGALDGCAIIQGWKFDKGHVLYQSRVLESQTYKSNLAANRIMVSEFFTVAYPDPCQTLLGKFQTQFLSLPDPKESTDNCLVNLIKHGDELYVTSETNTIHQIDKDTLETLDEGTIHSKYVSVHNATAHPHTDVDGTLYNLGSSVHMGTSHLNIIQFPPPINSRNSPMGYSSSHDQAKIVARLQTSSKSRPAYIHSFGFTPNYIVVAEHPFGINIPKAILSKATQMPAYRFIEYDKTGQVIFRVVNRNTNQETELKYYADQPFVSFHTINAFEENGHLVFDLCSGDEPYYELLHFSNLTETNSTIPVAKVMRYVMPLEMGACNCFVENGNFVDLPQSKCAATFDAQGRVKLTGQLLTPVEIEMPRINYAFNGKKYQYVYGVGTESKSETCLVKINVSTGETRKWFASGCQVFEPVFAARPGSVEEDDGVILSPILHVKSINLVELVILDAKTFSEIGRVTHFANGPVTPTLHGIYDPSENRVQI